MDAHGDQLIRFRMRKPQFLQLPDKLRRHSVNPEGDQFVQVDTIVPAPFQLIHALRCRSMNPQTELTQLLVIIRGELLAVRDYFGSSTSGSPFFGLPMITTLAFALAASFSVASMPFHSSNCGLIPVATIF
jgi:hypothetical protein